MAGHHQHNAQEKLEKAKAICEAYGTGAFSIVECCKNQAIHPGTFLNWCEDIQEIRDLYNKAKTEFDRANQTELRSRCLTSLEKLISGFEAEEVHEDLKPIYDPEGAQVGWVVKSRKVVKKQYAPNVTAVIFALKALESKTYREGRPEEKTDPQTFLINGQEIKF